MDEGHHVDPAEVLPDAFARLEQLNEDYVAAAIHEFKAFSRAHARSVEPSPLVRLC
jgi:hypothetical protein